MKRFAILMIVAVLSCGFIALPAFADDQTGKVSYRGTGKGEAMLFDLVFLRPAGLASVALGFAGTVVAFPFSVIANNSREVGEAMLGETTNYTFVRPLGEVYQPTSMFDQR